MIEWIVAHPHHVQTFFDGLFPSTRIVYGPNGETFVREFDLSGGAHVCATLSVAFNGVQITVGDAPIRVHVFPSLRDPICNGRYVMKGVAAMLEYEDISFLEILEVIAHVYYSSKQFGSSRPFAHEALPIGQSLPEHSGVI